MSNLNAYHKNIYKIVQEYFAGITPVPQEFVLYWAIINWYWAIVSDDTFLLNKAGHIENVTISNQITENRMKYFNKYQWIFHVYHSFLHKDSIDKYCSYLILIHSDV